MEDFEGSKEKYNRQSRVLRPGHADPSAGGIKSTISKMRAMCWNGTSARETAARVAQGALAKAFLAEFGNWRVEPM